MDDNSKDKPTKSRPVINFTACIYTIALMAFIFTVSLSMVSETLFAIIAVVSGICTVYTAKWLKDNCYRF